MKGRRVAREAQIQPSETSMKLAILSGTIASAHVRHIRSIQAERHSQVTSSEMEKSRMNLNRTKVAIQALWNHIRPSAMLVQAEDTHTEPRPIVIAAYHLVFLSRLSWRRTKTGAMAVTISATAEIALSM